MHTNPLFPKAAEKAKQGVHYRFYEAQPLSFEAADTIDFEYLPDYNMVFSYAGAKTLQKFVENVERHNGYFSELLIVKCIRNIHYFKKAEYQFLSYQVFYGTNPYRFNTVHKIVMLIADLRRKYSFMAFELTYNCVQLWVDLTNRVTHNAVVLAIIADIVLCRRILREIVVSMTLTCPWRHCYSEIEDCVQMMERFRVKNAFKLPPTVFHFFKERNKDGFLFQAQIPNTWVHSMGFNATCDSHECLACFMYNEEQLNSFRDEEPAAKVKVQHSSQLTTIYATAIHKFVNDNPDSAYTAAPNAGYRRKM